MNKELEKWLGKYYDMFGEEPDVGYGFVFTPTDEKYIELLKKCVKERKKLRVKIDKKVKY